MNIISHRGWSEGEGENTLSAFQKSANAQIAGIEFDIRQNSNGEVIVSHDASKPETLLFKDALSFLKTTNLQLFIELKAPDPELLSKALSHIQNASLSQTVTIFAHAENAGALFPFTHRKIQSGIIARYPWQITQFINRYKPDFLLTGFDQRPWTRIAFRLYWSIFSLKNVFQKHPETKFIIGIANSVSDIRWLSKQKGIYGITTDNPLLASSLANS